MVARKESSERLGDGGQHGAADDLVLGAGLVSNDEVNEELGLCLVGALDLLIMEKLPMHFPISLGGFAYQRSSTKANLSVFGAFCYINGMAGNKVMEILSIYNLITRTYTEQ